MDLFAELKGVVAALEERRIPYALCGGLAMAVHGFARATIDIDLFVPEGADDAIRDAVRPLGFVIQATPMNFARVSIRRMSKLVGNELLSLHLLLMNEDLRDVWASRELYEFQDVRITVVSREGLIRLKQMRNSSQDLADIERLRSVE